MKTRIVNWIMAAVSLIAMIPLAAMAIIGMILDLTIAIFEKDGDQ